MRYVVIGNSAAGVAACEAIRGLDPTGEVAVVSDEARPFYSRCLTSYVIGGQVGEEKLVLRDPDFYERLRLTTYLGRRAVSIDVDAREVALDDGTRLPYDRLLVATGGSAKLPEVPGVDKTGVFTLRTWEDAAEILACIARSRARRALVVGGGLVGIKVTHALHEAGLAVHVAVASNRVLSQMLDEEAASIVRAQLESRGITVSTNCDVKEITGGDSVQGAVLSDGTRVEAEVVVIGKGVDPNIDLVRGTPIKTDRGILVNEFMETTVPGVFAAGDVAQAHDIAHGAPRVNAMWTAATEQGRVAGRNMAGQSTTYLGSVGMNSLDLWGLPVISMGITAPRDAAYEVLTRRRGPWWYRKIVMRDGVVKGAIFVGGVERAGVVLALIRRQANVAAAKERLVADDFSFASFPEIVSEKKSLFVGGGKRSVQSIMQGCY